MEIQEIIAYGEIARESLKTGIRKIAKAVGSTMGPCGQNVIIGRTRQSPIVTKDGITVAEAIELLDPIEHMGAEIVRQAARATVKAVGDGTTTCTVLTAALVDAIPEDQLPFRQNIINDFNNLEQELYNYLDSIKVINNETLKQAILISSNNDIELTNEIVNLITKLGDTANISVSKWDQEGIKGEVQRGFAINKGMVNIGFINCPLTGSTIIPSPSVILVTDEMSDMGGLITSLNLNIYTKYIVIADKFSGAFIKNCLEGQENGHTIIPVLAPSYGSNRLYIMQDLEAFLDTKAINASALNRHNVVSTKLGKIDNFTQTAHDTFLEIHFPSSEILDRISILKANLKSSVNTALISNLQQRILNLKQNKGILYINHGIKAAQGERFDRAEDAVSTAKSALNGVVPGGGVALFIAANILKTTNHNLYLCEALKQPFYTILENRGLTYEELQIAQQFVNQTTVIDTISLSAMDAFFSGIVDPVDVIKTIIKYSFSAALQILTTGCALQSNFITLQLDDE